MTDLPDLTADDWHEHWTVTDDGAASWALRKIHEARRELDRQKANLDAEIDWLRQQHEQAASPLRSTIDKFTALLVDYRERLEAERDDLPKTYRLPCGTLSRRRTPPKVDVTDEEAFIAWALDNEPTLVAVRPAAAAIKAAVVDADGTVVTKDGGQVVPGVALTSEDRITVKPDLPGDL